MTQPGSTVMSGRNDESVECVGSRVAVLRGAAVDVDPRKVGRVVVALVIAALGGVIIFLVAAGVNKNEQITELHDHAMAVTITVKSCLGELGGSGSNVAGYTCTGDYKVGGVVHVVTVPGNVWLAPGERLRGVAAREDPSLFTLASDLRHEQASWRVLLAPLALAILLAGLLVALRSRSARRRARRLRVDGPIYDVGGV